MKRPGRNDACHCGSGKKYKHCHLDADATRDRIERLRREIPPADPALMAEVMPILEATLAKEQATDRRLREEYGVHINYVRPVPWQGGKVWAIGSRVYPSRPANETFHEFILHVLRGTLGEPWRTEQAALPVERRHFVLRCFDELARFKSQLDHELLKREGVVSAEPNGWVSYLIGLAWDVATLIHAADLPDALVQRLRSSDQFQGARYEIAIAAIFARLDCEIRFLDEDEELRGVKHVEFEATHRPTGQAIAVEAKSRHRPGVLNQPGERNIEDSLRRDARMVRSLFLKATNKAPEGMPFFVFIDMNAPLTADIESRWHAEVQAWMNRLPEPTSENPDVFNSLYVTNFSPHYDGEDISRSGSWLEVSPIFIREPLTANVWPALRSSLDSYGRIPPIAEDGLLA